MTSPLVVARKKGPSRTVILVLAVVVILVMLLIATAIGFIVTSADDEQSRITVSGEQVAFELMAPTGTAISQVVIGGSSGEADDCKVVDYLFNAHGLEIEAIPADCKVQNGQQIINGNHGAYRTMADVPKPEAVAEVKTFLGRATVFTQSYAEYTNTSSHWDEPVAVISFDDPVDPDYPTLVVRSNRGELDRGQFTDLVKGLSRAQ